MISQKDKHIIRELAKKQLELANSPKNRQIEKDWLLNNTFKPGRRPMIHIEMWTFENDVLPPYLKCEGEQARNIEANIYRQFLNQELFNDDRPIPDYHAVWWYTWFNLFGHDIKATHAKDSLGHKFEHIINDLEDDYHKLGASDFGLNREDSMKDAEKMHDLLGDILPIKYAADAFYAGPTQKVVHMMGMETMLMSIMDYPELFKEMMNRIAEDQLAYFKFLEKENLLRPTTGLQQLAQGSWCYTDELPEGKYWGYLDSQETVSISPQMYEEFIFPCYKKIADHYGLLSYGCCEPVHSIWDNCLSKLPNLRKVSISPWCDEEFMGDKLRGKNVVFHRKPSPHFIGVDKVLDEDAVRAAFSKTIKAAQGCTLEIAQRDVYTIHGDVSKVKRYVEIIREEISNH